MSAPQTDPDSLPSPAPHPGWVSCPAHSALTGPVLSPLRARWPACFLPAALDASPCSPSTPSAEPSPPLTEVDRERFTEGRVLRGPQPSPCSAAGAGGQCSPGEGLAPAPQENNHKPGASGLVSAHRCGESLFAVSQLKPGRVDGAAGREVPAKRVSCSRRTDE